MVGKTTFRECLALCLGANVFVGSVSGLTIVAGALGGRAVVLWPAKTAKVRLPEAMWTGWIKDRPLYRPVAYGSDVTSVLREAFSIWGK
jgi:ADP-heptose:LPS heptosyltransferase